MAIEGLESKERVLMAIRHQETDRIPRGELLVEEAFLNRLYPEMAHASYMEKMRRLAEEFDLDLFTVRADDERDMKAINRWVLETPYFVMALIDGLFWNLKDPITFEEFILGIYENRKSIQELIETKKKRALHLIQICLDKGAHGVIIGDDLAFARGPYVAPEDLGRSIFPGLGEIVEKIKLGGGVAFLHSCGNLTELIDLIISADFDGLHGLAPSAGNDPITIKRMTQKRFALMGVVEVDRLNPVEIQGIKKQVIPSLVDGRGYILGSAEGLSANTPVDSFRALYMPPHFRSPFLSPWMIFSRE